MFSTIFKYEFSHWLRQPSVYIYTAIFFLFSLLGMAGSAELIDPHTPAESVKFLVNSPNKINEMFVFWTKFILLLLPIIIGNSIYRDFKSNLYTFFFSYPFTKVNYLLAKFFSAFCIIVLILSGIGLGILIGTQIPGINQALLGPLQIGAYIHSYLIYVIPNVLIFGLIVFGVVALSRNIYAGFITVVCLFFVQGLMGALLGGLDQQFLAAILDPFGEKAGMYAKQFWTVSEVNTQLLPIASVLILNRLFWLVIALSFFGFAYKKFEFSQHAFNFSKKNKKAESTDLLNLGSINKVILPEIHFDFSVQQKLKTAWQLSNNDFLYIIKNWSFISIFVTGFLFVFFQQMGMNPPFGVKTLPVTWKMLLIPGTIFSGVIMILTFLFAGMLVHRERLARMNQLVDITPIPNWVLMTSKFLALVKMQILLLSFILLGGIITQLLQGFSDIQPEHYLFELYGLSLISFVLWACVGIFIQTLFHNPYLGLFLLILGALGMAGLPELGVEPEVLRYNMGPNYEYSDLDRYGATLLPYWAYKIYWSLFGIFLLFGAYGWWTRGLPHSFGERFSIALKRTRGRIKWTMLTFLVAFVAMGFKIYQKDTVPHTQAAANADEDFWRAENEKKYKSYEKLIQPRIIAVNVNMDIFPEIRSFESKGSYILKNTSQQEIDTLILNYSFNETTDYSLEIPFEHLIRDTALRFDVLQLGETLYPGDSLTLKFELNSKPNTFFQTLSKVKSNGTFFYNNLFPGLGYRPIDILNAAKRAKFGLPERSDIKPLPTDSSALYNSYSSTDSDWIEFEAVVSTSVDQIALAPGYLQKEWTEGDRKYFHYKMDSKVKDYYGFNSGRFEVKRDQWNDIDLEIYYHKDHPYNIDRMMRGLKGALKYNSEYFSPYQHRQARIIEFPITLGKHGTTFANSIPMSEIYFISDVNDQDPESIDLPFYVTAHEIAHQWWGNQLIPADVRGSKLLTESMAEYTALKVLEREYGQEKLLAFLKLDRHFYLRGRSQETNEETPLIYAFDHQNYINYRKGALALYSLSDYIGESQLNGAIKTYLDKVKFQEALYTTSIEMLEFIKAATPDSLQYLIRDLFETITLYDNQLLKAEASKISNGQYQIELGLSISKYRSGKNGKRVYEDESGHSISHSSEGNQIQKSLPLADFIEIGIYDKQQNLIYLEKHQFSNINNSLDIRLEQAPHEVVIDPFYKLIDTNDSDNKLFVNIINKQ